MWCFVFVIKIDLIIRLKEKYIVHAQDKKADLFEFLIKRFNNRPLLGHPPEVNNNNKKKLKILFGF
jgi:hypothetical protein